MRQLPREVDPLVFNMSIEDPGDVDYSSVGGLSEQIRELREVCSSVCWEGSSVRGLSGKIGNSGRGRNSVFVLGGGTFRADDGSSYV